MTEPSLALQDAIESALRGDAQLAQGMGGKVVLFTMVAPANTPKPYLVMGEDQVVPDGNSCSDSDDLYPRIHVWTRSNGGVEESRREAKIIVGHVRRILKADLTVPGFDVVDQAFEMAQHLTDPDGLTAHSVVDHRFHLDPA